jgi:hypothetical protein
VERKISCFTGLTCHGSFLHRFTLGSKDQAIEFGLYDGSPLVEQSNGEAIVVTLNYRVCSLPPSRHHHREFIKPVEI